VPFLYKAPFLSNENERVVEPAHEQSLNVVAYPAIVPTPVSEAR